MTESPFHLLGDQSPLLEPPKSRMAALGSVLVHALVAVLMVIVPWTPRFTTNRTGPRITLDLSQATPLIAPPSPLTQKLDNQAKPVEQVNLQSLLSRPTQTSPPPRTSGMTQPASPKKFEAPPVAAPPSPKPEIEAPKLDMGRQQAGEMVARSIRCSRLPRSSRKRSRRFRLRSPADYRGRRGTPVTRKDGFPSRSAPPPWKTRCARWSAAEAAG
jgi:hypothetical protein